MLLFTLSDRPERPSVKNRILFLLFTILFIGTSCQSIPRKPSEPDNHRFYTYAGLPAVSDYPNSLKVLFNEGYVAGYDETRGVPAWVAYRVESVDEDSTYDRPGRFLIDDRTENRISHDHYTHSGYDRGHMAPNYAIVMQHGEDAQRETFLMTNIIPQTPELNRQWWRELESLIARDYSETFDVVWVTTGPVFRDEREWLQDEVRVPSHNFKILKVEENGDLKMKAFLVPQGIDGSDPLEPYLVPVDRIEELTGFDFHPALDPEVADRLESIHPSRLWNSEDESDSDGDSD
ncbi:MAG: DNA/RNA non-specific endonuclease [Balneolaceae bacterium]